GETAPVPNGDTEIAHKAAMNALQMTRAYQDLKLRLFPSRILVSLQQTPHAG
ncbi:hypothetical protein P7K49_035411, partial [Saguinus oedipus]